MATTTVEHCGVGNDLLHRVVEQHLEEFLSRAQDTGRELPPWVEQTFRDYLDCGQLYGGFFHLHCPDCDHHRLVPFSCGKVGFCPSCSGRRMSERAAHWVDGVIPTVPVRQWVLSLPWLRRFLLAREHEVCRGVLSVFIDTVFSWIRQRLDMAEGQTGAVAVIQRFSSSLALNPHFHVLVLDGLYQRDEDSGELHFHCLPRLGTEEVKQLVAQVAVKVERWLARRGYGYDDRDDSEDGRADNDAQVMMQTASLAGASALGDVASLPVRRFQVIGGKSYPLPPLCAACLGYNLHAGVRIAEHDRTALERMSRYLLRPPLPKGRLEERSDGKLLLKLKKRWSDGTTALLFEPVELLARLAAMLPKPGSNAISYHGVIGARAAWRREVVPSSPLTVSLGKLDKAQNSVVARPWAYAWADLLWRLYSVNPWNCPQCGRRMLLKAVVPPPATIRVVDGINKAAKESARAPPGELAVAK